MVICGTYERCTKIVYVSELANIIDNGIDIGFIDNIGIDIDIDKTVFKLLILVLILIRGLTNY